METFAIIAYVISDEVLRLLGVIDDPQAKMSNAEVIAFTIFAAKFFFGNYKMARYICKRLRFFPNVLSNSRIDVSIKSLGCAGMLFFAF